MLRETAVRPQTEFPRATLPSRLEKVQLVSCRPDSDELKALWRISPEGFLFALTSYLLGPVYLPLTAYTR